MAQMARVPDLMECDICNNPFNLGARRHERSNCECGHSICWTCRTSVYDPTTCPFCATGVDRPRHGHLQNGNTEVVAMVNDLIGCVGPVRTLGLQNAQQLGDQQGTNTRLADDIGRAMNRTDHLLDNFMTHNNLLRSQQRHITALEAQVARLEARAEEQAVAHLRGPLRLAMSARPVPAPEACAAALDAVLPRWAPLIVPASVPYGIFPAGGAEEAKEEEDPPLALRALPEEPAEPRRSSRKRKGPDHGPFLF